MGEDKKGGAALMDSCVFMRPEGRGKSSAGCCILHMYLFVKSERFPDEKRAILDLFYRAVNK
jgi:hypothetical protein